MSRKSSLFSAINNLIKDPTQCKSTEEKTSGKFIILRKFDLKEMPRFLTELDLFVDKIDDLLAMSYQSGRIER